MSDDTLPVEKPKRGRGRPKGSKTDPPQRIHHLAVSMAEAVRLNIDPSDIQEFHKFVVAGINPIWKLDKDGRVTGVIPDPSPLAQTPDLSKKIESLKFLAAYGWGQPAQSVQIEAEFRARIEAFGSGIPNQQLAGINPQALYMLKQALELATNSSAQEYKSDIIDAQFEEVVPLVENSAPLVENKAPLDENNDK